MALGLDIIDILIYPFVLIMVIAVVCFRGKTRDKSHKLFFDFVQFVNNIPYPSPST